MNFIAKNLYQELVNQNQYKKTQNHINAHRHVPYFRDKEAEYCIQKKIYVVELFLEQIY